MGEEITPRDIRNTPVKVVKKSGEVVVEYEGDVIKTFDDTVRGAARAKGFAEGYTAFKK